MRIVAVVYEPYVHLFDGVRVTSFVVEVGDRWEVLGAYPDRPIPLPPGDQVGRPLTAYALALGIRPSDVKALRGPLPRRDIDMDGLLVDRRPG